MTSWTPRLVALDIDGTLLRWIDGTGTSHEEITPAVHDAVRRAQEAGAHVVLASGRSPDGMTGVADLLGLATEDSPEALVAVEERGRGYLVNRHFPMGELSGEMILSEVESMVAEPVSRVIIRDPDATVEEFVALAGRLGLHGTDYVVGWTAWLDLAPVGVSKASGLEVVCRELGVGAADVLAIGDGRNDVEMLTWAGRGVAMGQAVEEVRAVADAVTSTVDDDGAAVEMSRWWPA